MRLVCEWCHAQKRWAGNFGDFWKKQLVEIRTWAWRVELWSTGCAAHLLGQWAEIGLRAGQFSWGVDCGRCRNSQHSKNCFSLSLCRKTKSQKKLINVSYLNKESRQCFAYFGIPMHMSILRIRMFYIAVCYTTQTSEKDLQRILTYKRIT